ncbi:cytoplasmic protein [Corynebacterium tuscaniense]|uniref:Cytoplasmic protein n=1 Tax=Corynebacterium tuscaniense TaxID=302449 RepID=A0A2N6T379_9CORY|nr:metal-sensitive transcriptional regulator [Corynebacterium tuscaniense]KAA8735168.1 metal-sensitive transcriptional regulator [Corynebacterium tuscaniense]KGF21653.1 cytoplasmic protein [Corynebacterium tuscaniense DNF00037]PMC63776.1 cytoplasmic protein [Corynebacterium tuscaniense]
MKLNPEDIKPSITRLKRARGQIDAVIRMLESGEECEDAVTQLAAASKALDRAGYSLIATGLKQCYRDEGPEAVDAEKLEKLFLSLS